MFTARRKEAYEALHPETKHGGDRKGDQVANLATCPDRFTADTAAKTGDSERTVQCNAERLGWTHIDCVEVDDDEVQAELWEIAENLHRLDLTKDERDRHIRRYAELLEIRAASSISSQNAAKLKTDENPKGAGRPQGTVAKVADATGLSKDTVRRALNPKPPVPIKSAIQPESEEEAIIREANAIVAAWNRARRRRASWWPAG